MNKMMKNHLGPIGGAIACFLTVFPGQQVTAQTNKVYRYVPITIGAQKMQVTKRAKELLLQGDFDSLTKLAQQYRNTKETFPDGTWKLNYFYDAFSGGNSNEWDTLLSRLDRWGQRETVDPAPIIAYGNAYWAYGKQARGGGYASTVSREAWQVMHDRMQQGYSRLMTEWKRCSICPGFFVVMMKLGIDDRQDPKVFMAFFDDGIKLEPTYLHLYGMKSYYLLPRWYGKPGELRDFVLHTADRYPEAALWILWDLEYQGICSNVFREESVDWNIIKPRLKKCITPGSVAQANMLAYLADIAQDSQTRDAMLDSVDDQLDASRWRSQERLEEIAGAVNEQSK